METSNPPRVIKELSYDVLKSLIKYSTIEKRVEMVRKIPDLREIEKKIPFKFDKVDISKDNFHITIGTLTRAWSTQPPLEPVDGRPGLAQMYRVVGEGDPEQMPTSTIHYCTYGLIETKTESTLNMNYIAANKKLLQYYLRRGSKARTLKIGYKAKRHDNIFVKADHLIVDMLNLKKFNEWRSMIEDIPYKEAVIWAGSEHASFFNDPLVKTFQKMVVQFSPIRDEQVDPYVLNCENKHLEVCHSDFPIEKMNEMIKNWRLYLRPIGFTFLMKVKKVEFVTNVIDHALTNFKGVRSKFPDKDLEYCVTVPPVMDDKLEIVIFAEPIPEDENPNEGGLLGPREWEIGNKWTFKVEMLGAGATEPK